MKALYKDIPFVFEMIKEILKTSKLDDEKRLYEIIAKMKSRLQMGLVSSGHTTAAMRALSYFRLVLVFRRKSVVLISISS